MTFKTLFFQCMLVQLAISLAFLFHRLSNGMPENQAVFQFFTAMLLGVIFSVVLAALASKNTE